MSTSGLSSSGQRVTGCGLQEGGSGVRRGAVSMPWFSWRGSRAQGMAGTGPTVFRRLLAKVAEILPGQ